MDLSLSVSVLLEDVIRCWKSADVVGLFKLFVSDCGGIFPSWAVCKMKTAACKPITKLLFIQFLPLFQIIANPPKTTLPWSWFCNFISRNCTPRATVTISHTTTRRSLGGIVQLGYALVLEIIGVILNIVGDEV